MTTSKDKALIIIEADPNKDIFFRKWEANGYQAAVIFRKVNKPLRAIRRLFARYDNPLLALWLNDWYGKLDDYDSIIIHMSRLTRFLPKLLACKYPHLKVICWYWNTIDEDTLPIDFHNDRISYWSFDEDDCRKYGLNFNIQYYCPLKKEEGLEKENDIYFIGRDKGREEKIREVEEMAWNQGLLTNFHIIKEEKDLIPYYQVEEELLKTRAVLEINKKEQIGFTLRVMESLFYGLKLITDNKAIRNSRIYNPTNIFILDEDDPKLLKQFMNKPYDHSVDIYQKEYDLNTWFNNFYKD